MAKTMNICITTTTTDARNGYCVCAGFGGFHTAWVLAYKERTLTRRRPALLDDTNTAKDPFTAPDFTKLYIKILHFSLKHGLLLLHKH